MTGLRLLTCLFLAFLLYPGAMAQSPPVHAERTATKTDSPAAPKADTTTGVRTDGPPFVGADPCTEAKTDSPAVTATAAGAQSWLRGIRGDELERAIRVGLATQSLVPEMATETPHLRMSRHQELELGTRRHRQLSPPIPHASTAGLSVSALELLSGSFSARLGPASVPSLLSRDFIGTVLGGELVGSRSDQGRARSAVASPPVVEPRPAPH